VEIRTMKSGQFIILSVVEMVS